MNFVWPGTGLVHEVLRLWNIDGEQFSVYDPEEAYARKLPINVRAVCNEPFLWMKNRQNGHLTEEPITCLRCIGMAKR